jgi:glycosyltransferase involved in cell wall biosynthesis
MTPSLNILQSCFSRSWGGLEMQALETARRLRERGHDVLLACTRGSRLAAEAAKIAFPSLPLDVTGYLHPGAVAALRTRMRERDVDLIHAHHSRDLATLVPAMLLSGRRRPLVLTKSMGSYLSKKDLLHRFTFSHVQRVLAVSRVIAQNVAETTPAPPERIVVFPYGVDLARFVPAAERGAGVRREFSVRDDQVLVGFMGRFSPGKGLEELLEAARRVADRNPAVRFLAVGEPSHGEEEYAASIRRRAGELRLDGILTFAGFRRDVPEVMAAFDIFAFPSHAEAFGIVLIEAMAMARPVVSTDCDGVLDIVRDGETGIMVPPRRADRLAAALERLASDTALRRRLGDAGRRVVEEEFDLARLLRRLEAIYADVIAETSAAPR